MTAGHGDGRSPSATGGRRAVSPVIGVILMVAIVVILAAIVGTFVTSFGDDPATRQPNLKFTFEFEDDAGPNGEDTFHIVHDGGETIYVGPSDESSSVAAGDIYILADEPYEDDTFGGGGYECPSLGGPPDNYRCSFNFDNDFRVPGDEMTAGERFTVYGADGSTPFESATVKILYRPENSARSYVLAEWRGPEVAD
jgi:flagellin-like protein